MTLAHCQPNGNSKIDGANLKTVNAQNVSPPASIPFAYLEEIKLVFEFTPIRCRNTSPASKKRKLEFTENSKQNSAMPLISRCPIQDMECIKQCEQVRDSQSQLPLWLSNLPLENVNLGYQPEVLSQEAFPSTVCLQNIPALKAGKPESLWDLESSADVPTQTVDIVSAKLANMIDLGLRSMICENVVQRLPDIKLLDNSSRPKLAEVSPTLFSPGYIHVSDI